MGGDVGRVILPVALTAASIYTGGLVPAADVWAGPLFTAPPGFVFKGSTLALTAAAGAAGLNEIGAIRRERAAEAARAARDAAEAKRLREAYEAEDRRRRLQVKRRAATLRARFAASGTGAAGGSAAAVIGGLRKVADDDRREARHALDRRLDLLAPSGRPDTTGQRFLKQATGPVLKLLDTAA